MKTAAEIICYVQPVTSECDGAMAWVDVTKTASIRGRASTFAEAKTIISEAMAFAKAMNKRVCVKTLVRTAVDADRLPNRVKSLQGSVLVG